jgi:DNA-directed RNA polymerase specialized sigma subunit
MIIVASKEKPFFYTPKGSIRRSATLELYEAEIHTTYHAVAETAQEDIPVPPEWSLEFALPFVRRVVSSVIKASLEDDDDLFQHGCDR